MGAEENDDFEKFVLIRFTSRDDLKRFSKLVEEGVGDLLKSGGEEKFDEEEKDVESSKSGSLWSKFGADHYDEKGSEWAALKNR